MRYVRVVFENGYAGCDEEFYMAVLDDVTDKNIEDSIQEEFYDYCDRYCHIAAGYDMDEGWEDPAAEESYYEGCSYSIEEATVEEYVDYMEN